MKIPAYKMALWSLLLLGGTQVPARNYIITDTNDTTALTSLRGAMIDVNEHGGINFILFSNAAGSSPLPGTPWVLHLTLAGANEAAARTGDLDVRKGQLTIAGPAAGVTIDASGLGDRVFQVVAGARLSLVNVTLVGGTAPGNYSSTADGQSGGAIWNAGSVSLLNCTLVGNASGGGNEPMGNAGGTSGGDGGAIYNRGSLILQNCVVTQNSAGAGWDGAAGGNGGGLYNAGECTLKSCRFESNRSGDGGESGGNAAGQGGKRRQRRRHLQCRRPELVRVLGQQ